MDHEKQAIDPLVANDFDVPLGLSHPDFVLHPLGPEHDEMDYRAWTSSIDHIRASPGFGPHRNWPTADLSPAENLRDLEMHARDHEARTGFTYTVLDADTSVIGCVYIYSDPTGEAPVEVRSWVTADRAELDPVLRQAVDAWLRDRWPFPSWRYAGLESPRSR